MSRTARLVVGIALVIGALGAVRIATPESGGRTEVGRAVRGVVALVDAGAPENDIFNGQFCGGVLVGLDQVLTAAHCVVGETSRIDAVVDADNLCRDQSIGGVRNHVVSIVIHPSYDSISGRFDLALAILDAPQSPASVRGIAAASSRLDETAVVLGWGRGSPGGVAPCRVSQRSVRVLDEDACEPHFAGDDRTFDRASMVCAVPATGGWMDTCSGDSGGPLILGDDPHRGTVFGIVSWGRGCGGGVPGVYARASAWSERSP